MKRFYIQLSSQCHLNSTIRVINHDKVKGKKEGIEFHSNSTIILPNWKGMNDEWHREISRIEDQTQSVPDERNPTKEKKKKNPKLTQKTQEQNIRMGAGGELWLRLHQTNNSTTAPQCKKITK